MATYSRTTAVSTWYRSSAVIMVADGGGTETDNTETAANELDENIHLFLKTKYSL